VEDRYALARDAFCRDEPKKGEAQSRKNCRFGYRKMKMIQKRLPKKDPVWLLLNEERREAKKMLQWLESPLHEERSMQMTELLAGCLNADDEMMESKNFFWLVVKMS
jgi:hypothetical protein